MAHSALTMQATLGSRTLGVAASTTNPLTPPRWSPWTGRATTRRSGRLRRLFAPRPETGRLIADNELEDDESEAVM